MPLLSPDVFQFLKANSFLSIKSKEPNISPSKCFKLIRIQHDASSLQNRMLINEDKYKQCRQQRSLYLRNRKYVPCFYRVIETPVKVWENEKCCGNTSRRRVFPQLFRVLPNFHECFYNSIGTRRTCFLFLLENTATKKKKNNLFTSIIRM